MSAHWTDRYAASACADGIAWARRYNSLKKAWNACDRAEWMLWLLVRVILRPIEYGGAHHRALVRIACEIARGTLLYVPPGENRPRLRIEAAEAWVDRPSQETKDAAASARYVARVAKVESDPAWAARNAAGAAGDAVGAPIYVVGAASYAALAATGAAGMAARRTAADIVRGYYPVVPRAQAQGGAR